MPKEFEGKTYMARTIRNFNNDIADGMANVAAQEKMSSEPNTDPYNESSDAFGRRLAIHGMVNGLLTGGQTPTLVKESLSGLFELEDAIDLALSKTGPAAEEILNVEDIPFSRMKLSL